MRRTLLALLAPLTPLALAAAAATACAQVAEPGPPPPEADRPVILVTGSTGGLGREVAMRLARTGAHVIVHGRNAERGSSLVRAIEEEGVGSARFYPADLASFAEVRRFAGEIRRDYDRLDVLVNNAGIGIDERRLSEDGHELHFQVNYLSGYLLTRLLLPLIVESAPARVVNVVSRVQAPIDFDDVMAEADWQPNRQYGRSKVAQVMFTFELARELEDEGVTVNAVHPARMMNTDLVLDRGYTPVSTVEEGAESVVHAVIAPGLGSGHYFHRTDPSRAHEQAYDEEARRRLMRLSAELTGAR